MASPTSLMVNLCAGDAAYAHRTVPALLCAHEGRVAERVVVLDTIRPAGTRYNPPPPKEEFHRNLGTVTELAAGWLRAGMIDRIEEVRAGDPGRIADNRRMLGAMSHLHHNARNVAITALVATFARARHRHMVRYDADMLLYQREGTHWPDEAIAWMERDPRLVAATPRVAPPFVPEGSAEDRPCVGDWGPRETVAGGWAKPWFSMRCMVVDRERLARHLPLLTSTPYMAAWYLWARATGRGYPLSLERVLSARLARAGARCLNLSSRDAWLVHPQPKGDLFLRVLPGALDHVRRGVLPPAQRGAVNMEQEEWERFLAESGG